MIIVYTSASLSRCFCQNFYNITKINCVYHHFSAPQLILPTVAPVVSGKLENRPTAPMHVVEGDWNRNRASRDLRLETRSPPHLPTGPEGHSALKGFQPK